MRTGLERSKVEASEEAIAVALSGDKSGQDSGLGGEMEARKQMKAMCHGSEPFRVV